MPGEPWQPAIESVLNSCNTVALFIGKDGIGPWQHEEMRAAVERRVSEEQAFRVIPVLLPGNDKPVDAQLPTFLRATTWVEFASLDDQKALRRFSTP